jgi:hypothetical protein
MYDCPKFSKCSAPLCPLDPDWKKRSMTKDERVCFYLREAVKEGAQERFQGGIAEEIYFQAVDLLPEMLAHSGSLQKRLQKARTTGSKINRRFLEQTDHSKAVCIPAIAEVPTDPIWHLQSNGTAFTGTEASL